MSSSSSVSIDLRGAKTKSNSKVHLLPFSIQYKGKAKVASYFDSTIHQDKSRDILKASFRGNPLNGHVVEIPKGFIGTVVDNKSVGKKTTLTANKTFYSVTSWKWDQNPKSVDEFKDSLDWVDVAAAIHSN